RVVDEQPVDAEREEGGPAPAQIDARRPGPLRRDPPDHSRADAHEVEQDARLEGVEELSLRPALPPVQRRVAVHHARHEAERAECYERESDQPREALGRHELSHGVTLRREPLDDPAVRAGPVPKAVVEPIEAMLPELPHGGPEPEAAPALGSRYVLAGACAELRRGPLELLATLDDLALRRDRRRQTRPDRPRPEVRVGLAVAHPLHRPLGARLAPELVPVEDQSGTGVLGELATFPAAV